MTRNEYLADLETITDWHDELEAMLSSAKLWTMTPKQFERLELAFDAFASFVRILEHSRALSNLPAEARAA